MNNRSLIEALTQKLSDLDQLMAALEITNPHNAKQAVARLRQERDDARQEITDLCQEFGASHIGNLRQKFAAMAKAKVTGNRLPFLASVPYSGYVSPERAEVCLNRLDKKCRALLSLGPAEEYDDSLKYLATQFRQSSYEDFLETVIELHALQVHGTVKPPAIEQQDAPQSETWFSYLDKLDEPLVTNHLNAEAIKQLAAAPRSRLHATNEGTKPRLDLENKDKSRRGEYAFSVAKNLLIDLLWPDVEPLEFDQSDQGIAFSEIFPNRQQLFDALNDGGTEYVKELTDLALAALD